jgi:hypothetical protein
MDIPRNLYFKYENNKKTIYVGVIYKYNKQQGCAFEKKVWRRVADVKFTMLLVCLLTYVKHFLYLLMKRIKGITIAEYLVIS